MNKQYSTKSPEYYKKYHKDRYEELHKKHICDVCGGSYNAYSKATHMRSKKHKNGLEIQFMKQRILNM